MVRSIANAYRVAYGGLPKEVWVLSLALFINRSGAMVLAFMTLYLTKQLSFTTFQAGLIFSVWGAGSLVGAFVGGKLSKPFGSIPIQNVALILAVPLYLIIPLFTNWWAIATAIFFCSISTESVRPANMVAVSQFTTPELTTRAFGLQRMAVNLGFSIGPAVGGILATYNYHWLFIVDGITTGLAGAVLLWHFGFQKYAKDGAAAEKQKAAEQTTSVGSPFADARYLCFLGLMLLVSLIFFQFHAVYPKYLADHYRMHEFQIGLMFSVNTIIIVVLEMILLDKIRAFSLLRMIGWGSLLACFGFGILPLGTTFLFCVLSMTVITFGEMLMFPLGTSFVAHRSRGRDQGMYMSGYAMMYSTAGIIAPAIGTLVYQYNRDLIWHISFAVGVIVLGGFYMLAAGQNDSIEGQNGEP